MINDVRKAVLLSLGERYVTVAIGVVQMAIVSRILSVEEIGLAALGMAVVQLADALREFGVGNYLIQRREVTQDSGRTAFTFLLALSGLFFIGLVGAAGALGSDNPDLRAFLAILAFGFLLAPVSAPIIAMMRRNLQFGSLAVVNGSATIVQATALISLAWLGFGAMSFAWAAVTSAVAMAVTALAMRPDLIWIFRPSLANWREALSFGGVASLTGLVNRAYEMLPIFVLGRWFPLEAVGLYSRAVIVSQAPEKLLFASLAGVVLPVLSREARGGRPLASAYLSGLGYITVLQWPAYILVALLAHPLVLVLLGEQWSGAVPIVQIIALASLLYFPAMLTYPTLVASGAARDALTSSLIHLPIGALIVMAGAWWWGPTGLAASQFLAMPLLVIVDLVFVRRRAPFRWIEIAWAVRKSAVVALASAAAPTAIVLIGPEGLEPGFLAATAAVAGAGLGWFGAVMATNHPIYNHIKAIAGAVARRLPVEITDFSVLRRNRSAHQAYAAKSFVRRKAEPTS
ncbi:lipopolysaccharide biosynthesis protein [Hansschlegelia quercus]|uniref:Lipopolysaccharide biosynthesis protein n=1 Tax=Hansschlegelia quercus TaxID=2528245 RepID=A0A4Q9G966_9HYPH|nr:lipopolysaccharide biosynthesis protein [Hansschlegelia quercus]TBN47293.1 lipopolysaccharide biosynthesis protein [Hansschlegelia quercus]